MRTGLVALTVIVIALAIFNPGMDQFRQFVRQRTELAIEEETGGSMLGRALSGAGASLAGDYVDRVTERENYYLFSTYTIDLDGAQGENQEWRFLGIAGQFFAVDRPEERANR